jgi:hypothetical protein
MQVPGVEADDVIGTLAVNSVSAGYKVNTYAMGLFSVIIDCLLNFGLPLSLITDMLRFGSSC